MDKWTCSIKTKVLLKKYGILSTSFCSHIACCHGHDDRVPPHQRHQNSPIRNPRLRDVRSAVRRSEGAPPESEPVLNGTNVVLDCGGSKKSLAQAVADINGFYKIVYNTTDSVLFDPSTCVVIVGLPIIGCFIYPPVGTLQATLTLVGLLEPVFKAVAIFAAGPLKLVT